MAEESVLSFLLDSEETDTALARGLIFLFTSLGSSREEPNGNLTCSV